MSDSNSDSSSELSFFTKHEFAIRRLHSLTGIVPLGLYMCVHLTTNASLLGSVEIFQRAVFLIHSPGPLLPLIEWGGIFLPLIFHAVLGIWIAKTGKTNSSQYRFTSNRRYSWQRWTGFIGLVYLFLHVMHLHGGVHAEGWMNAIDKIGFGQFSPYNAGSSLVAAMNLGYGVIWPVIYLVGVLALVYHFINGIWTAGITWGLWISPQAQARATKVCVALGVVLTVVSLAAWAGAVFPGEDDVAEMRAIEDRMYEAGVVAGTVPENEHKRDSRGRAAVDCETEDAEGGEQASLDDTKPAS
ncbi:Succinate dehydrogenase cytochrome b558 subunit [Stieleria maiorica]|uniref:Succinate dehydrogenase cytochrome b558 subunit n=1 Tax=Stieleria maiorica TaxID=2795974 RepID=A0A5B9MIC1_9BACT|nr:succinate dehydrogenase cytochrome b558 subunit [Stieleria maiorica]QEF99355.1 Succinate dehydrogenase cytochrome b558 subunit [Stieleria maiorica]